MIHFAVAGGHFDVAWSHGMFLAVVAWLQLSWAAAIMVKPSMLLLRLAAIGNTGVIAVWLVSRLWGAPGGPDAWSAEPVSLADALATVFEVGIVATAVAVLVRPALAQKEIRPSLGLGSLGATAVAMAVVSTVALAPSFASDHHGHDGSSHDDSSHGDDAAHDDDLPDDHSDHESYAITADGTSECEKAGVSAEGNHGHRGPAPTEPLDEETRKEFAEQVALANQAVADHPTVADAEAAGYRQVGTYIPCVAAHYVNSSYIINEFDPEKPGIILYAGTDPGSEVVGLSYLVFADEEPEGFAGPNDHWHSHEYLCFKDNDVIGLDDTSQEACDAREGEMRNIGHVWMNHMWNVPGWESRWGLFSSEHPDLGGRIGDIHGEPDPSASDDGTWLDVEDE